MLESTIFYKSFKSQALYSAYSIRGQEDKREKGRGKKQKNGKLSFYCINIKPYYYYYMILFKQI